MKWFWPTKEEYAELIARLTRIERSITDLKIKQAGTNMATAESLEQLQEMIRANTDAVTSASAALTHYAQTTADLTQQLREALGSSDQAAINDAIQALEANNAMLMEAIPTTAEAVAANTKSGA